ncbi:MAG TPA: hypothetical protein PKH91_08000 [Flavobacterium sp.]|nr:hypothetical protein [Flavobacterium sp.]
MEHKLKLETYVNQSITVIEEENTITISVYNNTIEEYVTLTKKELHSFIGTLLHVQQKMK